MIHALTLPWGSADELRLKYGLKMIKGGIAIYSGPLLPRELRPYASEDYTYERWVEDERNATTLSPDTEDEELELTEQQAALAARITGAAASGLPGFIAQRAWGGGTEISVLAAISGMTATAVTEEAGSSPKVLIASPKGNTAQWRSLLRSFPGLSESARIMVADYSQLPKLLMAPPQARISKKSSLKARQVAKAGEPTVRWDFIVFDGSDRMNDFQKHRETQIAHSLSAQGRRYVKGSSPFVIYIPDELSTDLLDLGLYAKLFEPHLRSRSELPVVSPKTWSFFLRDEGFSIAEFRRKNVWRPADEVTAKREIARAARCLSLPEFPFARAEQTVPFPSVHAASIRAGARAAYTRNWMSLRRWLNLHPASSGADALREIEAYSLKCGFPRSDAVFDLVLDRARFGPILVDVAHRDVAEQLAEKLIGKGVTAYARGRDLKPAQKMWREFLGSSSPVVFVADSFTGLEGAPPGALYIVTDPSLRAKSIRDILALRAAGCSSLKVIVLSFNKTADSVLAQAFLDAYRAALAGEPDPGRSLEAFYRERAARRHPHGYLS